MSKTAKLQNLLRRMDRAIDQRRAARNAQDLDARTVRTSRRPGAFVR